MKSTITIIDNEYSMYSDLIFNSYFSSVNCLDYLPEWLINMESMSGKKYKHFINQLISRIYDPKYLEIGTWTGSTACSALYKNRVKCYLVDNWDQFNPVGNIKEIFFNNIEKIIKDSQSEYKFEENDFRLINYNNIGKYNIYFFDGPHEEQDQYDGVVYAQPALEDEFIFICDDWNWNQVRLGTTRAFRDLNLKINYSLEIRTTIDGSTPEKVYETSDWHNGYFIAACKK